MKKTLKNSQMDTMLRQLKPFLNLRDKIGYAAARNYRRIMDSLTEYLSVKNGLIEKYGAAGESENGRNIFVIEPSSPNFRKFLDELAPFEGIEHEVELMTVPAEEAIGSLTGNEILEIDWMLED